MCICIVYTYGKLLTRIQICNDAQDTCMRYRTVKRMKSLKGRSIVKYDKDTASKKICRSLKDVDKHNENVLTM